MELPLHPSDPEIDTTRQEKVARRKRSLLELATELGNVSKACRVMGYSRQGYGQFWGMRSGSGLVLGSDDGLAVAEADTANDLGEAVGAVQSAPVALG